MSANDRQVGGTHYKQQDGQLEHWDLSIMYRWDPFQYQITKYVMRWKDKYHDPEKQLEDLKKARHFLDKYIEEYSKFLPPVELRIQSFQIAPKSDLTEHESQSPRFTHDETFLCEGGWGDGVNLYTHRSDGAPVKARSLQEAHEEYKRKYLDFDAGPTSAYVNQGRD